MIGLGCKRIGYVSRKVSAPTIGLRIAGFRHAMDSNDISRKDTLEFCGDLTDGAFIDSIIAASPEALICANDTTAMMLMRSVMQRGIKIPQDFRMIGIDDVKIASMAMVPLTSIHQPCRAIGSAAVNTMVRRIENRKMRAHDIQVDVELVVRDSCGSPKS